MEYIKELEKLLDITITEDYTGIADLTIETRNTADSYEVYVVTDAHYENGLIFDEDVFYYEPSFEDDIMSRVKGLNPFSTVFVSDIETFFPEPDVEQWVENFKEAQRILKNDDDE